MKADIHIRSLSMKYLLRRVLQQNKYTIAARLPQTIRRHPWANEKILVMAKMILYRAERICYNQCTVKAWAPDDRITWGRSSAGRASGTVLATVA
jgi:hypothetical protein